MDHHDKITFICHSFLRIPIDKTCPFSVIISSYDDSKDTEDNNVELTRVLPKKVVGYAWAMRFITCWTARRGQDLESINISLVLSVGRSARTRDVTALSWRDILKRYRRREHGLWITHPFLRPKAITRSQRREEKRRGEDRRLSSSWIRDDKLYDWHNSILFLSRIVHGEHSRSILIPVIPGLLLSDQLRQRQRRQLFETSLLRCNLRHLRRAPEISPSERHVKFSLVTASFSTSGERLT